MVIARKEKEVSTELCALARFQQGSDTGFSRFHKSGS
jgi:hypothetical protein